jgi:light-harvesting complex 1 beta chain
MEEKQGMSGLTANEAAEFMGAYELGLWTFVTIASLAHIAVWVWRPWF